MVTKYQRGRPREGAWFVEGLGAGPEGRKLARRERKGKHITVGKYALLRNIKKDPNSMIEKILQLVKKLFLSFMIDRVVSKY